MQKVEIEFVLHFVYRYLIQKQKFILHVIISKNINWRFWKLSRIVFPAKCCGEPFKTSACICNRPWYSKFTLLWQVLFTQHCVFSCLFQVTIVCAEQFSQGARIFSPSAHSHFFSLNSSNSLRSFSRICFRLCLCYLHI